MTCDMSNIHGSSTGWVLRLYYNRTYHRGEQQCNVNQLTADSTGYSCATLCKTQTTGSLILSIKFTMKEKKRKRKVCSCPMYIIIHIILTSITTHHPTEPKQLINFFPVFLYLFFSSPLVSFSLVSLFFLFPKSRFSWMGCSRVISMLAFVCQRTTDSTVGRIGVPFAGCTPSALPNPIQAAIPAPIKGQRHSHDSVLLLALCWFGNKLQGYSQSKVSVILIISHHQPAFDSNEHRSTLQISYRWLRTSPRKSAVPLVPI